MGSVQRHTMRHSNPWRGAGCSFRSAQHPGKSQGSILWTLHGKAQHSSRAQSCGTTSQRQRNVMVLHRQCSSGLNLEPSKHSSVNVLNWPMPPTPIENWKQAKRSAQRSLIHIDLSGPNDFLRSAIAGLCDSSRVPGLLHSQRSAVSPDLQHPCDAAKGCF